MIWELSDRQRDVVKLVACGYHNKDIAETLDIQPATVKNHLTAVYRETGAGNRVQLAVMAFKWGLLSVNEAFATMQAAYEIEETAEMLRDRLPFQ